MPVDFKAIMNQFVVLRFGPNWEATDFRIFWKIVVQVVDGNISVVKHASIWLGVTNIPLPNQPPTAWCRFLADEIGLTFNPIKVPIDNNAMVFNGLDSVIEAIDIGLEATINHLAVGIQGLAQGVIGIINPDILSEAIESGLFVEALTNFDQDNPQELQFVGRNIYIEADIDTDPNGFGPIFVYPQFPVTGTDQDPCRSIILNEIQAAGKGTNLKRINWQIFGNDISIDEVTRFYLADNGFHNLFVDQYNCNDENFRYLVDSIPLPVDIKRSSPRPGGICHYDPDQIVSAFPFSSERVNFFIGHNPYENTSLSGSIRRIVFDPNANCPGCV